MLRRSAVLATALTVLAAAFAFALASVPAARAAAPVRIMALGDSITGSPGCWRALLWQRLTTTGFTNIDFVGTLPPQGCGFTYDGENEGHGGFLATNVADQNQLPGWLSATLPDVVLMHFGTNDVWNNRSPATILAAFSKLVDQMRASNPSMRILVAQIIPMNPSNCAECAQRVVALNQAIPGWAAGKTTAASPITVVDQWTGFSPASDTFDGVHPNDSGNVKISNKWYPPLTAVLNGATQPPDTQAPSTPGTPATSVTCNSVTLTWSPSSDNAGVAGYRVERAIGTGAFTQIGTPTTTTFTDTGRSPNTTYRYRVRAADAAGNLSPYSAIATATTTQCPTTTTTSPPPPGGCTATARQTNSWPGHVQGEVAVRNNGTTPINWRVTLTFAGTIEQMWGGSTTQTSSPYTINNESWNGNLGPGASTTFGFIAVVSGTVNFTVTCTPA